MTEAPTSRAGIHCVRVMRALAAFDITKQKQGQPDPGQSRDARTVPFRLKAGTKSTNGRGFKDPDIRRTCKVTLGQRSPGQCQNRDPHPGSTRDELVPRPRLQEPRSLTSGTARRVQPKVCTDTRQNSPSGSWEVSAKRQNSTDSSEEKGQAAKWEGL